jgi:hypothetical protein
MLGMQVFQMMCNGFGSKFETNGTKCKRPTKQRRRKLK